jgi:hypothetical protein
LDGYLGVAPRRVGIAFVESLCDLGGIILAEKFHDRDRRAEVDGF